MALKLDTPAELQAMRLALQIKQLKDRFSSAATGGVKTPLELLLGWCAQPGVADARDRQRSERMFAAMAKGRIIAVPSAGYERSPGRPKDARSPRGRRGTRQGARFRRSHAPFVSPVS